ncbi:hypothetical protein G9A89_014171 [Geosiphon pyriformis]|nr:hypothetical protein G9A89_014169 [Geosiphon pyriformis]KAG9286185.1 hypothetical protein G9A89_014171 [Geosiphon pyriformis]
MSSTSSIKNATSPVDWLEGTLMVINESLPIFPACEYSKVADLVKKYFVRNQKTPEDLFNCLNNKKKAFELYSKAAEAGHLKAQNNLLRCYRLGWGTKKNLEKVFKLYLKAADAGNEDAKLNLGVYYANGRGTTKNVAKALKLFLKPAKAGNKKAQHNLRLIFHRLPQHCSDSPIFLPSSYIINYFSN